MICADASNGWRWIRTRFGAAGREAGAATAIAAKEKDLEEALFISRRRFACLRTRYPVMTDDARDGLLDEATQAAAFFCFSLSCLLRLAPYFPPLRRTRDQVRVEEKKKLRLIIQARGRTEPDRGRAVLQKKIKNKLDKLT